ncbi:unnamed protein product [Schistosoma margrebowiei]|uniref:Uncharacterized protein n=1 Tax=Schistosoma margrebowiei TaxID=48269 RepID=A0A183NBE6_9TREM|nr:unnamed protein product [Schistosoma margrebowiei]
MNIYDSDETVCEYFLKSLPLKPPSAVGGAAGTTGGPGPGASEGVLANFFNSLLSKRTTVVGGVGGIGTSASLSTQGSLGNWTSLRNMLFDRIEILIR